MVVDVYLQLLAAWQEAHVFVFRKLIHNAHPSTLGDWKWNVPVFLLEGKVILATSGIKVYTKYNSMLNCALLQDKDELFNSGFEFKKSHGINLKQIDTIDEAKLKYLITESVALIITN